MSKFFGLTIDGLLPSKAKAEVEGVATAKAEDAVSDVRATAELASEKVSALATRVTTLEAAEGKLSETAIADVESIAAAAVTAQTATLIDGMTAMEARIKALEDALVPTTPEPTGPAYVAAPTNGKDGAMTNAKAITFTASSLSSPYHREAAHLSGSGPHPLVIHLHGDGYEEYTQYNSGTANSTASKYAKVAVDNKALFILPRTPDTDSQTWWSKTSSTTWLVALIRDIKAKYNIDERRIFISGYSGGAEEVTYNLACDYHTLFKGGGTMLLGGGGAEGLTGFTGTPAADIKSDFLMRWWYGETDNGVLPSDTTIDAISASAEGEAWYKTRGFNTGRTMIPGVNHYTSEPYGPDLLRQLIDESNTKYGV